MDFDIIEIDPSVLFEEPNNSDIGKHTGLNIRTASDVLFDICIEEDSDKKLFMNAKHSLSLLSDEELYETIGDVYHHLDLSSEGLVKYAQAIMIAQDIISKQEYDGDVSDEYINIYEKAISSIDMLMRGRDD